MTDQLFDTIRLHRELYRADPASVTRMVARHPPTTKDRDGTPQGEPADAVGMNLSARLIRYLGHPEGYGEAFPWRSALWYLRAECRREHRYHREVKWNGSLCETAVRLVVMDRLTIREASRRLGYSYLARILREGLQFIEDHIDARRSELDQGQELPVPPLGHLPLPGLHAEECPSCRRALALAE